MTRNSQLLKITQEIAKRSEQSRAAYLDQMEKAKDQGVARRHMGCSNLAHVSASMEMGCKQMLAGDETPNIGIITAYNDMLSAHKPFEDYPRLIRQIAEQNGATAQVAGGVPAMCDGVTQGMDGMELSLFSRDVIAMSAAVGLSHACYDGAIYLGMCDKIAPGLVIAAARFGHLPAIFLPAGPMPSGISNGEKAKVRQQFAAGEVDRSVLLKSEMAAYHAPGICTFYGTANTNQMILEVMGLQLSGSSAPNPNDDIRPKLTLKGAQTILDLTFRSKNYTPACDILSVENFVNAIVGLHATGGSTNLAIHLLAMARAAGILLTWDDMATLSEITPLIAKVYPNGELDVNHFYQAGGVQYIISECLSSGLMHENVKTVMGDGLSRYAQKPALNETGDLIWQDINHDNIDETILRKVEMPFQPTGGLMRLKGNLGQAVMKISAVKPERRRVHAPAKIFHDQESVKKAFEAGELHQDFICVVRFQGPKANGMPELHGLTPILGVLQDLGYKIALLTDGRMSGASGKIPAAIHLTPEAAAGGLIAKIQDGDMILIDGNEGILENQSAGFEDREAVRANLTQNQYGTGRELFSAFRDVVGGAETGASVFFNT